MAVSLTHCVLFSIGVSIIGSGNKDALLSITICAYLITYAIVGQLKGPENIFSISFFLMSDKHNFLPKLEQFWLLHMLFFLT